MTAAIVVRDELGTRFYDASDFPLSIGRGDGADLRLPGLGPNTTIAFIGLQEGAAFVQSAASGIPVFCNERLVESSRWLESGDTIRIDAARIACELSDTRLEFRVSDAAPSASEDPVIVVPPPRPPSAILEPAAAGDEITLPQRAPSRPSAVTWALSVAAALLVAVGWFLLRSKAVDLDVRPEPDRLSVEGSLLPLGLGGRRLLRPGRYVVVAEKQGFYTAREPILVGDAASQSFSIQLERLPGLLTLAAGEVEGAIVSVDGMVLGVTPLVDAELQAGVHTLSIESERHLPHTLELSIEGGGVRQRVDVDLTPAWSVFEFVSDPPGAELIVDGEAAGLAPITAELSAGQRVVELALAGYETWRADLTVRPNQALERREVLLAPADGTLTLRSQPSGASVSIDGQFRGRTPAELSIDPDELHRIELFKRGYDPAVRRLRFEAGEERTLTVRLLAQYGELELISQPEDAELLVDGVSMGNATQKLRLSALPHQLEIQKSGYESFRTTVTLQPGFPEQLHVQLSTLDEAEVEDLPLRVETSLGQELRLVRPGHFRMGASRREQGRRSNEVLREIVLTRPVYLAAREVTNAEFRSFAAGHSSGLFQRFSLDEDEQPVVRVSWHSAARYCNWLSQRENLPAAYVEGADGLTLSTPPNLGYRLVTEAEWVWAARYSGDNREAKYPWGEALPPTSMSGNYADTSARATLANVIEGYRDDYPVSAAVGSFRPNALGIYDLGGNVAEWVHDYYAVGFGSSEPETDPFGPSSGKFHVLRGSSWQDSSISELRLAYRDFASNGRADVGFRIARYAR